MKAAHVHLVDTGQTEKRPRLDRFAQDAREDLITGFRYIHLLLGNSIHLIPTTCNQHWAWDQGLGITGGLKLRHTLI